MQHVSCRISILHEKNMQKSNEYEYLNKMRPIPSYSLKDYNLSKSWKEGWKVKSRVSSCPC